MPSRRICPMAVLLSLALAAGAPAADDAGPPKSAPARAAIEKYDRAIAAADAAYHKAQPDARRLLMTDLEAAKKEAMRTENLPEANAIEAAIRRTRAEAAAAPNSAPVTVTGTWDVTFNDGGKARYTIDGRAVDNTGWRAEYQRDGNELRFRTPVGESVQLVFTGEDQFSLSSWRKSPAPFKGPPTFTGVGKRVK